MSHTPRCMSGITRPRDLRVVPAFRASHLDRLKIDSSLSSTTDTLGSERVAGPSREADPLQVLPGSRFGNGPVEVASLRTAPPNNPEVHLYGRVRPHIDASLLPRSGPQLSFTSHQTRSFHTSSRLPYDSTSYNVTEVPDFFVKYKQHRVTSAGSEVDARKHGELGLMQSLANSILSGDVVATTRRLKAKVPVEHYVTEGQIIHPSGFVVPGPGHTSTSDVARAKEKERNEKKDRLVQTAAVAHRVLESDFEEVDATTLPSSHKVPFEVREADGTVKHPSGFVPPTPADKFRYTVNPSVIRDCKVSVVRRRVRQPSPSRVLLRAMHTNASDVV